MTAYPALPYNTQAEQAVLGSLILDRDAIIAVAPWLMPEDFYHEQHRWIYEAVLTLYAARTPPDYITIAEVLRQAGRLDEIGGAPALVALGNEPATSYHVEYYARIVADCAVGRAVIAAGASIAAIGHDPNLSRETLVAEAQERLTRATQRVQTSELSFAEQVSREFRDGLQRPGPRGLSVGLGALDRHLAGGLHPEQLILVAARPSVGKSALALAITRNVAQAGGRVLFASLEMTREELWQRLVAIESGVPLTHIRQPELLDQDALTRVVEADGVLSEYPIAIDDDKTATVADLRSRALALQAQHGHIALVVVDYLQLVAVPRRRESSNRQVEVAEISRGLKRLAGELGCPVLALSQLNREVERRSGGIPLLSDLRESGALEQDSDVVLFLHRDELSNVESGKKGICDVFIAKHRQGALGMVPLRYNPDTGRWFEIDWSQR